MNTKITAADGITLITLQNIPSDMNYINGVFEKIAGLGVDVDMISMSPAQSNVTSLSFTINDTDLETLLEDHLFSNPVISSSNMIISVFDADMAGSPGFASRVFKAAASVDADIRIITTSEVQISVLVAQSDYGETFAAIQNEFNVEG